ncbi:MAG: GNAT family N-acetyltransferase [Clostridiales bacterium]|jgi:ribosomal protein S18 acetylase RimI-like enzyme|nr:GNAT family N-acetyltransferase [Clostridiales bacterium]
MLNDIQNKNAGEIAENSLQVIPMTIQHIPFLHGLFQDTTNKNALHAKAFTLAEWQEVFAASQADRDEELFVVTRGGSLVAWIKINGLEGDTAWISMLVVDSRHHREGIGSFAVRFAEEYAIKRGFVRMGIHTTEDNIPARECYKKAGYAITDSGECHGSDGIMRNGYTFKKSFCKRCGCI